MIASSLGRTRTFKNHQTGQKESFWIIREEIYVQKRDEPPHDGGNWGKYYLGLG